MAYGEDETSNATSMVMMGPDSGDFGFKSWFCSLVTGERFEVPPAVCVGKAVLRAQMKLLPPSPTTRTTEGT